MMLARLLFLCGAQAGAALAKIVLHGGGFTPDHVLRVTQENIAIACEHQLSVVVNGTSPGPPLRLAPGQTSWIRVYNDMAENNLTMHWHGLAQRMAPFSDGSPAASQWPIPPGRFFDYEIEPQLDDSGTYFYHSHVAMQALSCSGALIVDDCGKPPYDYDDERILHFGDYFDRTQANLTAGLEAVPFVWSGEVNAVLLNGQGVGLGHSVSSGCTLPVIDVEPGKTYRFRFIGATGLSHTIMAFEDHADLRIVQVDGGERTRPAAVDRMQLGSGQRFDVLFRAKTAAELAAAGRSSFFLQFETRGRPAVYRGYAVLRYSTPSADPLLPLPLPLPPPPAVAPFNLTNATYDWLEYALTPLDPSRSAAPTLAEVTRRVVLDAVQLVSPATGQTVWRMAGVSWTERQARTPLLVDIYRRGDAAVPSFEAAAANGGGGWDPATGTFPARVGEVLELVLQNTGSLVGGNGGVDVHPFHAHGQHYYDVGSGNGTYDAEANEARMVGRGYTPVRRDTTMLYRYASATTAGAAAGWRAWRVRVEQPGVWLVHCHSLQHMIMGMQTAWIVGTADEIRTIPLDESQGYLYYGGDVYGNETHAPSCHHKYGNPGQCARP